MHINMSICGDCDYFEHECAMWSDGEGSCSETCRSPDKIIRENFYNGLDYVETCDGFKSEIGS